MKNNFISFLLGAFFMLNFFVLTAGIFMPKKLTVSSIEIIDDGSNESGYIIIKNKDNNIVSYLGVGKGGRGILTLKNQLGETKINISSNESGGYFKANDLSNQQSVYINN